MIEGRAYTARHPFEPLPESSPTCRPPPPSPIQPAITQVALRDLVSLARGEAVEPNGFILIPANTYSNFIHHTETELRPSIPLIRREAKGSNGGREILVGVEGAGKKVVGGGILWHRLDQRAAGPHSSRRVDVLGFDSGDRYLRIIRTGGKFGAWPIPFFDGMPVAGPLDEP